MKAKKRIEKKRKNNFLKEQYIQSWNYIKSSRNFIWGIFLIFLIFALIGFFVPAPDFLSKQIFDFIKDLVDRTSGMSQIELVVFIFNNNLFASFLGMISGFFFGIYPIIASIGNGYLVGFVGALSVNEMGFSVLLKLLPHGIFELPAVFISLGLGIKFGTSFFVLIIDFFKYYYKRKEIFFIILGILLFPLFILLFYGFSFDLRSFNKRKFSNTFWNSIRVFIFVVLPLLIIAAIIEGILISFLV